MEQLRLLIRKIISENALRAFLSDEAMLKINQQVDKETKNEIEKRANNEKIIQSTIENIQKLKDKPNKTSGDQHVIDLEPELIKQMKQNYGYSDGFDEKSYRKGLTDMYVNNAVRAINTEKANAEAMAKGLFKEDIVDQFVTALEGGSNYWYYIKNLPKDVDYSVAQNHKPLSEAIGEHIMKGGYIQFYDVENKSDLLGTVDMDSILEAISSVKADYPEIYTNMILGDADAGDADVFLQLCVMGEVVFG